MAKDTATDQKRGSDGRFISKSERVEAEAVRPQDDGIDPETLERRGVTESEGGSRIEELLEAADDAGVELPEGADPDALEAARERLEDSGDIDAAVDALEEMTREEEREAAERDAGEFEGDPVPFSELSEELGVSEDAVIVTAKVDGEEVELPLSEALAGYQRQEAFTRKTQELAEHRRELTEVQEAYAQQLEMLAVTLGQNMSPEQQRALAERYNAVVSEITAREQAARAGTVEEETEKLRDTFDWEDDSEWQVAKTSLKSYATSEGFSEEELAGVTDARLLTILEKARRYDQMEGNTKTTPKTLKPGDRNPGRTPRSRRKSRKGSEARKKLAQTGRLRHGAAAIEGILADEE